MERLTYKNIYDYVGCCFYKFNRYVPYLQLIGTEKTPILKNNNTNEIIKGIDNINRYIINNELETRK